MLWVLCRMGGFQKVPSFKERTTFRPLGEKIPARPLQAASPQMRRERSLIYKLSTGATSKQEDWMFLNQRSWGPLLHSLLSRKVLHPLHKSSIPLAIAILIYRTQLMQFATITQDRNPINGPNSPSNQHSCLLALHWYRRWIFKWKLPLSGNLKLSTQWLLSPNPRAILCWRLKFHISHNLCGVWYYPYPKQDLTTEVICSSIFITSRSSCIPVFLLLPADLEEKELRGRAIPARVLVCAGWRNAAASQQSWLWCMTWGWEGQG